MSLCDGSHLHQHLIGGRAAAAALYPPELCKAICRGLVKQRAYDNSGLAGGRQFGRKELKAMLRKLDSKASRSCSSIGSDNDDDDDDNTTTHGSQEASSHLAE